MPAKTVKTVKTAKTVTKEKAEVTHRKRPEPATLGGKEITKGKVGDSDVHFADRDRSSAYQPLCEAVLGLKPGELLKLDTPDDRETSRFRLAVANAIRSHIAPEMLPGRIRVRTRLSDEGIPVGVAVVCLE